MVEAKRGAVVISLAGHDKGDFQVILECDGVYAKVCDGKHRPIEKVKNKKLIHVKVTSHVASEKDLNSNKSVRRYLRPFIEAARKSKKIIY